MKLLKVLNLTNNKLIYLPQKFFEACHEIHASDNKIKIIDADVFYGLNKIIKIELRGNLCIESNLPGDLWSMVNLKEKIRENCENPFEEKLREMCEENSIQNSKLSSFSFDIEQREKKNCETARRNWEI